MKKLVVLLLVLIGSIWLGLQIQRDPGYVLIVYRYWTVETSLWIGLASVVITFIVLASSMKFLAKLSKIGSSLSRWKKRHRMQVARRLTKRGLVAFAEGEWQKAEKYLSRGADYSDMPLINYLAAAKAAQEQNNLLQRDQYLQEAFGANPEAQIAISLTQAQLQISYKQWEQALATLTSLLQQVPEHPFVYKLLYRVYCQLNDSDSLLAILPNLHKYQLLPAAELTQTEINAYHNKLLTRTFNLPEIQALWQKISRQLRKTPELVHCYAELLIKFNQVDEAVDSLQDSIKKHWDNKLVRLYGLAKSHAPDKQLKTAEAWLQDQPDNPVLLLCLGRLCTYNQLWGKARSYLEASLAEHYNPESYAELAKLLEQLDLKDEAMRYYREGLIQLVAKIHK